MWAEKINQIALEVINEKVVEALSRINSTLPVAEWRSNGRIEMIENGVSLFWDNELIVYWSVGTGAFSEVYLAKYSKEIQKEIYDAFFVSGKGTMRPADNLLPVIFDTETDIIKEIDKRVEEWFKGVKL